MSHRYLLLDLAGSPPCVVHLTDDKKDADDIALRYATQNGRYVAVFESKSRRDVHPAQLSTSPLTFASFASAADAQRAGFSPPSGDGGGEPSGDGSKK
jgi:hypothetical protein